MNLLEIIWVILVILIIIVILITDPKNSKIGINSTVIANNLDSQRFIRNFTWFMVVTFYFLTIYINYIV
jgi:protein translocase SecG subunit